ncbi:GNAT family N-acetyltransferase [Actinospica sp.]|uniref:GNAT family N-acetyltransferase n=1 Tax=Actinospica sp. TaxID=1872142 RepID=UPI002C0A3C21|nr:GNAT family N-acetyltransferase [Actinospica sp.]HWG23213.1 GNAT family N-acetyltransferase [Actinospica sp.]
MTLRFEVDPELSEQLRAEIVACWTDVSNAGGAVGFVPPVSMDDVLPKAEAQFAGVLSGRDRLVVARTVGGEQPGRVAALAFLVSNDFAFTAHWQTVKRVMVHPDFQGDGYGFRLMAELAAVARQAGSEQLHLDVRGGGGTELFYKKCGYAEYGRMRQGIKLPDRTADCGGATPYRDLILMSLEL